MGRVKRSAPSPAMIVAVIALVLAVAGSAVAAVATVSVLSKREKKQTRRIADREVKKLAPGLSVKSADSAKTAATASNADQLGGKPSADYVLAHSRGVALAGAEIEGNGTVDTWFNTLGGAPTVSTFGGSGYDITFPGLGDASQTVLQATPLIKGAGAQITVDWATLAPGQTAVEVLTFDGAGAPAAQSFYLLVYGASSGG
jgi:hypothetical protein